VGTTTEKLQLLLEVDGAASGARDLKTLGGAAKTAATSVEALEAATLDLAKAQDREKDASGRVRAAEAKLADLRGSGKAKTSQLVAAEEQLAKAQRGVASSSRDTLAAQSKLTGEQKRAALTVSDLGDRQSKAATLTGAAWKLGAGVVAVGALRKMAQLSGESIKAASDLNETTSKTRVVFGDSATAVIAFGKSAAKSLGQSQNQALTAAGNFGNLFHNLGLTDKASAKMSIQLVKTAGDLASFNNASPEEMLGALQSALAGEFDPLQRFGFAITAAAVEQEALRSGLAKTKADITPAIKAQATYGLILKQTGAAAGDFARTSGGLANQQRIATAEFENAKAELGAGLLPVQLQLTKAFVDAAPAIQAVAKGIATIASNDVAKAAVLGLVGLVVAGKGVGAVRTAMDQLGISSLRTGKALLVVGADAEAAAAGIATAGVAAQTASGKFAMGSAASSVGKLRGAAGGLAGFLGGPWGVALVGATAGVGLFAAASKRAKDHIDSLTAAIEQDGGAIGGTTREYVAQALAQDKVIQRAAQFGIAAKDVLAATLNEGDARKRVTGIIDEQIRQEQAHLQLTGQVSSERLDALNAVKEGIHGESEATGKALDKTREKAEVDKVAAGATNAHADAAGNLSGKLDETAQKAKAAAEALGLGLTPAVDKSLRVLLDNQQAAGAYASGLDLIASTGRDAVSSTSAWNAALHQLGDRSREAADASREVGDAQRALADAQSSGAEQITSAQRALGDAYKAGAESVRSAEEALTGAQDRQREAQRSLTQARRDAAGQLRDLKETVDDALLAEEGATLQVLRAQQRLKEVNKDAKSTDLDRREAILALALAQDSLSDAQRERAQAVRESNKVEREGVNATPAVVAAQKAVTSADGAARDARVALTKAHEDSARAVAEAQRGIAKAQQDTARAVADAARNVAAAQKRAGEVGSHSLNIMTAAGRENVAAFQSAVDAAYAKAKADRAAGKSVDVVNASLRQQKKDLENQAIQAGYSKTETHKLLEQMFKVPSDLKVKVSTPGLKDAIHGFDNLNARIDHVWKSAHISKAQATSLVKQELAMAGRKKAAGGAITGPGTGTSDDVPIWASAGEHMWTAKEVRAAGGHQSVRRMRKAVLAGGYARGGPVRPSATVPLVVSGQPYQGIVRALSDLPDRLQKALGSAGGAGGDGAATLGAQSNVSGNAALVKQVFASMFGWSGGQWNAAYRLLMGESGFRNTAQNPTSSALGIGQFLDSTWATVGGHKTFDPYLQAVYTGRYIKGSYGNPVNAYAKWSSRSPHWYHGGGPITEDIMGVGRSGRTYGFQAGETVVPRSGGGGVVVHGDLVLHGVQNVKQLVDELQAYARSNGGIRLKIRP
jgi:hypothetical protein